MTWKTYLLGVLVACGGQSSVETLDRRIAGLGEPCVPPLEMDPRFQGFDEREVSITTGASNDHDVVCLADHFRGRVSCPLGQTKPGECATPYGAPVTGEGDRVAVRAQCTDRCAAESVYWSCRCANGDGKTDDGARYCTCTNGLRCEPLVTALGESERDLAGSYCVRPRPPAEEACASSCTSAACP